jgi:hypothetical protein
MHEVKTVLGLARTNASQAFDLGSTRPGSLYFNDVENVVEAQHNGALRHLASAVRFTDSVANGETKRHSVITLDSSTESDVNMGIQPFGLGALVARQHHTANMKPGKQAIDLSLRDPQDLSANIGAVTNFSVAIGKHARAGLNSINQAIRPQIAIGNQASSTGVGSIVVGGGATCVDSSRRPIVIGEEAAQTSGSLGGIVIGDRAFVSGDRGVAIGSSSMVDGNYTNRTNATQNAIAIGYNARATGISAISLGDNSVAGTQANAVAIGYLAAATSSSAISVGLNAAASGSRSIAIGDTATSNNTQSVAIGRSAAATGFSSVSMGNAANSSSSYGVSIGPDTTSSADNAVALGYLSKANFDSCVALGPSSLGSGTNGVAVGFNAKVYGTGSVSIGENANASLAASIAILGNTTSQQGIAIGVLSKTEGGAEGVAIGTSALSRNQQCVALGEFSSTRGNGSIALNSIVHRTNNPFEYGYTIHSGGRRVVAPGDAGNINSELWFGRDPNGASISIETQANGSWLIEARIIGWREGFADTASFRVTGVGYRNGGNFVWSLGPVTEVIFRSIAACDSTLILNNNWIRMQVTTPQGQTWCWSGTAHVYSNQR